ncbi:MAG: hypothetical protein SH850_06335 [Planctomycetaceae bacterium]|nr:hypothetical protein [Planctomycetaceae bacterium]
MITWIILPPYFLAAYLYGLDIDKQTSRRFGDENAIATFQTLATFSVVTIGTVISAWSKPGQAILGESLPSAVLFVALLLSAFTIAAFVVLLRAIVLLPHPASLLRVRDTPYIGRTFSAVSVSYGRWALSLALALNLGLVVIGAMGWFTYVRPDEVFLGQSIPVTASTMDERLQAPAGSNRDAHQHHIWFEKWLNSQSEQINSLRKEAAKKTGSAPLSTRIWVIVQDAEFDRDYHSFVAELYVANAADFVAINPNNQQPLSNVTNRQALLVRTSKLGGAADLESSSRSLSFWQRENVGGTVEGEQGQRLVIPAPRKGEKLVFYVEVSPDAKVKPDFRVRVLQGKVQ